MAEEKVSIAKIVKEIILSRPAIKECLILDVINYSALARVILKELEKENIKTSAGAVKMALIRIGEGLKKERAFFEEKIKNVVAKTVIELQSDLTVITAERRAVLNNLEQLFKVMENARFFQLTQGVETFTLVLSSEEK
ncbi:ACT domain-containing protein, partial [Thermococci archaeon]